VKKLQDVVGLEKGGGGSLVCWLALVKNLQDVVRFENGRGSLFVVRQLW
jgi:hypothetical protein